RPGCAHAGAAGRRYRSLAGAIRQPAAGLALASRVRAGAGTAAATAAAGARPAGAGPGTEALPGPADRGRRAGLRPLRTETGGAQRAGPAARVRARALRPLDRCRRGGLVGTGAVAALRRGLFGARRRADRSEERRVGKECRARWSANP